MGPQNDKLKNMINWQEEVALDNQTSVSKEGGVVHHCRMISRVSGPRMGEGGIIPKEHPEGMAGREGNKPDFWGGGVSFGGAGG